MASYMENVMFACSFFNACNKFNNGHLDLNIKSPNFNSIALWQTNVIAHVMNNIREATKNGNGIAVFTSNRLVSESELEIFVKEQALALRKLYPKWMSEEQQFYNEYVLEQFRLAALFPHPTSEILRVTDSELMGDELPDRTFLLTFDDGPTVVGGQTDQITKWLRLNHVPATFFVLYGSLRQRLTTTSVEGISALYAGMCVGSHGKYHKPHPSLPTWKESIDDTSALISTTLSSPIFRIPFRPPYGQLDNRIGQYLKSVGMTTVLWNIDSQDWNSKMPLERVSDRVSTLMLLWRRGIVLFHDTHSKALVALPSLYNMFRESGIVWMEFRDVKLKSPYLIKSSNN